MNRASAIAILFGLITGGYALYGLENQTGPAGWLIYLQQSLFGRASPLLTFFVLFASIYKLAGVIYAILPKSAAPAFNQTFKRVMWGVPGNRSLRVAWVTTAAAIFFTWLFGIAAYAWSVYISNTDADAVYEPIELAANNAETSPKTRYVALKGVPLAQAVLRYRESSSNHYSFVPIVAATWVRGAPIRFVVKLARPEELDGFRDEALRFGWLVHIEGAMPVPAMQALKKANFNVSDETRLVRWIPSLSGKPTRSDPSSKDLRQMLFNCGAVTAIILLLIGSGWVQHTWRERRKRKAGL